MGTSIPFQITYLLRFIHPIITIEGNLRFTVYPPMPSFPLLVRSRKTLLLHV